MTVSSTARQQTIFRWLWNPEGVLHRYRVPDHLGDVAIRAEVGDLVQDLDATLPDCLDVEAVANLLPAVHRALRRRHGGLSWPSAQTFIEAATEATLDASRASGADAALGWLASFYAAHGRPLAGVATPERTAALIRRGTLTAREARYAGFPMTDADDAEARSQPACDAEIAAAIRCRARLRGITEAAARAELIAVGDIPAHRRAA